MVAEKRRRRSLSFSLLSCFTGVTGHDDGKEPSPSYQKLAMATPEADLHGNKKTPTIKLGGKAAAVRSLSLSPAQVVGQEVKGSPGLGGKMKEACEQVLEVAKKSSPHLSELFVGGQLFMHVAPGHFGPKACSKQSFSPSIGFLHITAPAMDASLQER